MGWEVTRLNNPHLALLNQLRAGQNNARTGRELAQELQRAGHIPHDHRDPARIVRQMVHDLRAQGVPICADSNDGFYLPAEPTELEAYIKRLGGRIHEILKPYNRIKRTLAAWQAWASGQTSTAPEQEPLPHIPEPYRGALLRQLNIQQAARTSTAAPPTAPNPPAARQTTSIEAAIKQLILQTASQMPINKGWTLERAVAHVTAETCKALRTPPYRIPIPLNYMVAAGYDKDAVTELIRPIFERKMAAVTAQTALITEEDAS
jgi:hypothetical protein